MKTILFVALVATILVLTVQVSANTDELPQGKECAPGTHWKSQCNDCGCTDDGMHYCTKKGCEEEGKEMRCAPDSRWKADCNGCWCMNGIPACTLMGCPPSVPST